MKVIRDEAGVKIKFGVSPQLIPDYLALVGDSADGYPGIPGIGKTGAAKLLNQYGAIENFPKELLQRQRKQALLFKKLATLRTDAILFDNIDQLQWHGPTPDFNTLATKIGAPKLIERARAAAMKVIV